MLRQDQCFARGERVIEIEEEVFRHLDILPRKIAYVISLSERDSILTHDGVGGCCVEVEVGDHIEGRILEHAHVLTRHVAQRRFLVLATIELFGRDRP